VLSEALKTAKAKNLNYSANKIKYARKFVQHFELSDMSNHLKKHIEQLVAKIKFWNK